MAISRRRLYRKSHSQAERLETRALLSTITVTSLDDNENFDGEITLREAVKAANEDTSIDGSVAGSGADTIVFAAGLEGKVQLSLGLQVTDNLIVDGPGIDEIAIDTDAGDVFWIGAPNTSLEISGTTISGGDAGVMNTHEGAQITLRDTVVTGNTIGVDSSQGSVAVLASVVDGQARVSKSVAVSW